MSKLIKRSDGRFVVVRSRWEAVAKALVAFLAAAAAASILGH